MAERNAKDIQNAIVGVVTSRGNLTVTDIARRLSLRPHMVRYHLDQLVSTKRVLLGRKINYRAFGYQVFNVFFDLPRASARKGLESLKRRPEVIWLTQNVGPRQFEVTLVARTSAEFTTLLHALGDEAGVNVRDPIVGIETEERYWGLRYLADAQEAEAAIMMTSLKETRNLDIIDAKIARFLRLAGGASVRDISRGIGSAQSTVTYRLERLREWGALSEDIFFSRVDHDFVQAQIALNLKVRTKDLEQMVIDACTSEPYVEGLITGVGGWDFKIILRADTVTRLIEIEDSMLNALGRNVARAVMYVRNSIFIGR